MNARSKNDRSRRTDQLDQSRHHRRAALMGAVAGLALLVSACGSTAAPATQPLAATPATAAPAAPTADATVVKAADSTLGEVLTTADGQTLYGFTNDTDATSTCFGTCATAWPPLLVAENWTVAPGLDSGIFSTIIRTDGQRQLVAGKWPLYTFAGDSKAGDVTGQGSGDVWFVVGTDAKLIKDAAAGTPSTTGSAPVTAGATSLGSVLVDEQGRTLYGFTDDKDGTSSCNAACANAWPPVTVNGEQVPAGLDPAVFSVIARADGTHQLKAGTWPLYRFSGDADPGDVNGQGSGGKWFVVQPDGKLVKGAAAGGAAPSTSTTTTPAPSRDKGGDY